MGITIIIIIILLPVCSEGLGNCFLVLRLSDHSSRMASGTAAVLSQLQQQHCFPNLPAQRMKQCITSIQSPTGICLSFINICPITLLTLSPSAMLQGTLLLPCSSPVLSWPSPGLPSLSYQLVPIYIAELGSNDMQ